ncbi:MAG: hypothetical protein F4Z22_11030 [Acidimicrobiia bacterium]|nr:hypothetical protein [Acidimicrobiia bacterium]
MTLRLGLVLTVAAGLLAVATPAHAEETEPSSGLVAQIEERIASLEAQGKKNAQQRWERALAAVLCQPGAMSLDEIERRAGRRFNTELWVGVLAAARACAADPSPDADAGSDDGAPTDASPQQGPSAPSPGPESDSDALVFFGSLSGDGTPSDLPPSAMDPGDGGDDPGEDADDELPFDAVSAEPSQNQQPNRRPVRLDKWPSALEVFGAVTERLSLSAEFNDPDGDTLNYSVTSEIHGGVTVAGATATIESDELVITTVNRPSATTFNVTAKDGSSDCPTSSGGTMECRASSRIIVRVREAPPPRSESDYVNITVAQYGIGLEGINWTRQGDSAQGCVPFSFELSKPVPRRFTYEYKIIPVADRPGNYVSYGGGLSRGAPASFFDEGTTNVWREAGFQHRMNVNRSSVEQTTGGFCVQVKGVTAHSGTGALTFTNHCPAGQFRHFFVEMRIPEYWANLLGLRIVGSNRSIMNFRCQ